MPQQQLLKHLLSKNHSGLPQKEFLKKLATIYPWFAPAQFYLLQQLDNTEETYAKEAAKTSLLFNNPLLLQYQLKYGSTYDNYQNESVAITTEHSEEKIESIALESGNNVDIKNNQSADTQETPIKINEIEPLPTNEEVVKPEEKIESITIKQENNVVIENIESAATQETPIKINEIEALPTNEVVAKTEEELMLAENENYDDEVLTPETEIEPLRINIPGPVLTNIKESTLTFEPMHLVDYFASQGIKLSDTEQTADKLGKQLKSFTEWLKVMKKINTSETEKTAKIGDISIIAMAEKSNTDGETLTEAMAEVLVQQGKGNKAIEVYKKLSLLNPSKIAYFAAKIEQLKGL